MAATRMISIIGLKNAGKTTFLVALAAELVRRKFRVMTIKHGSHPAEFVAGDDRIAEPALSNERGEGGGSDVDDRARFNSGEHGARSHRQKNL